MAVDAKHPEYSGRVDQWRVMEHCYEGEEKIKEEGETYLPATPAQEYDGLGAEQEGGRAYASYKLRAVYPDYVRESVENMIGVMHRKPAVWDIPPRMEELAEQLTVDNEDANQLLRLVNQQQLAKGRLGLLVEVPDGKSITETLPFVAIYNAESIINWSDGETRFGRSTPDIIVLDETGQVQNDNLDWVEEESYRVLATGAALERVLGSRPAGVPAGEVYVCSSGKQKELAGREWTVPSIGGKTFDRIPFVFVNVQDLAVTPDRPPMKGLADTCLAIYRGDADYRYSLFMQGQETLVISGDDGLDVESEDETRIGAGAIMRFSDANASAQYVGVSGTGLTEQREALKALHDKASQQGMQLLANSADGSGQQSGEALDIRVGAQTASLVGVARAGAGGVLRALRMIGEWMGVNPESIDVKPNLDFATRQMSPSEVSSLVMAKQQGAPLSWKTIHANFVKGGVTEFTYDEEIEEIEQEEPIGGVDPETGLPLGEEEDPPEEVVEETTTTTTTED